VNAKKIPDAESGKKRGDWEKMREDERINLKIPDYHRYRVQITDIPTTEYRLPFSSKERHNQ
jgi:hypothetical protein